MDKAAPENLDQLAERLLDQAAKAGAEAAEVFQSFSISYPVHFEANRLKQVEQLQTDGTALRLWKNGRPGLMVAHGAIPPEIMVERAIALSELNQAEPVELSPRRAALYPDLGQACPVSQLIAWGEETIALVREDFPEILCAGEWDCEIETTRLLNSNGLDIGYTDTTLSCYLLMEWIRGDDFLGISDGQVQRDRLSPQQVANQIKQRLVWANQNTKSPKGRVPILFTSKAADILWGTVQSALNGKQVLERASPWSDRQQQQVCSPLLTVLQDPQTGPFSCPFDDEGTTTQPLVFLQNGSLKNFYADRSTARELGLQSTGNGFRSSLSSYPTPSLYNLVIQNGFSTSAQMISRLDNGLIVDQTLGESAGITGDFSVNIDLGYRVQNGQVVGRVKDSMVSGNVYSALKDIIEIGDDGEWNGACYTPSITLEGLSVTSR